MASKNMSILIRRFLKKEIGNSKRVLDIGCGDGITALYLVSSLNCRIDGVDMERGKVHRANEKFRDKMTRGMAVCHVLSSEDVDRKFGRNTFDNIILIHTLHHVTNLRKVLKKIRSVLKIRGKIFIGEYDRNYGEELDNCARFSGRKIKSMLKTAGFKNIKNNDIDKVLVMVTAVK